MRRFLLRLWHVVRPSRGDRELAREIASHLALLEDAFVRRGMSAGDAQLAARRTREIGIRIALGARRDAVIAMVIREVLGQAAIGTLVGVPAAFGAVMLIRSALYGVSVSNASSNNGSTAPRCRRSGSDTGSTVATQSSPSSSSARSSTCR